MAHAGCRTAVSIFQCWPIAEAWEGRHRGHCINLQSWFLSQTIPNTITDAVIVLLPLPLLARLHVPKPQKLALIGVFLLGGSVVVISIVRLVISVQLGNKTNKDVTCMRMHLIWLELADSSTPGNYVDPSIWSCVETTIGLCTACVPSMVYLFKKTILWLFPSKRSSAAWIGEDSAGNVSSPFLQLQNGRRSEAGLKTSTLNSISKEREERLDKIEDGVSAGAIQVD
ncbi:hypothetical protein ACLMJK_006492 [Lecanora helva]